MALKKTSKTIKKKGISTQTEKPVEKNVEKTKSDDHSYGTASFVLGILSLLLPIVGFGLGILAIVFYGLQRKIQPTGLATAGMVLGIISLSLHLLLIIAIVVILIIVLSAIPTMML